MSERESISSVSGHSHSSANRHYVKKKRERDLGRATNAFQKMYNKTGTITRPVVLPIVWGLQHPDYLSDSERAIWTRIEIGIIGRWCTQTLNVSDLHLIIIVLIKMLSKQLEE